MGRRSFGAVSDCAPRSVRLFRVKIDSTGYDEGGAYWGHGKPLYCAQGRHFQAFTRAHSRTLAAQQMGLTGGQLVAGLAFSS